MAGKGRNGVREGPETDVGNEGTEQTNKVVRLPRDWLGPREHLVPFGTATPPEPAPEEIESASPADAFWGEDAAAIHHPFEAPASDPAAADAPRSGAPRLRARQLPRRRWLATGGLATAAAVVVLATLIPGSPQHALSHGARLDIAAILTNGVERIGQVHLPRIATTHRAPQPKARVVHHVAHRAARITIVHRHLYSPAPTYAETQVVHTPETASPPPAPSRSSPTHSASSTAAVSPTGQSGALGPISSPNG